VENLDDRKNAHKGGQYEGPRVCPETPRPQQAGRIGGRGWLSVAQIAKCPRMCLLSALFLHPS
jgi:hypothetical protein